jgi:Cu/Ag efflux pump CusA
VIQAAARQRLVPVITSILAVAAFAMPFVVLGTRPGLEIVHSLAVVLLGGLITTALVTLLGLPAIYRQVAPAPAAATEEARP